MLFLMTVLIGSGQQEWSWSVHPESGFRILTPCALVDHVTQVPTDLTVIEYHQYRGGSITDSLHSIAFVIDHYCLPQPTGEMDDEALRDFFDNTLDPLLSSIQGTLVYMDIRKEAKRNVCSWKGSYQHGEGLIRGTCILTEDKYYGLQAFGLAARKPEEQMNRFLDSFQLLDIPRR